MISDRKPSRKLLQAIQADQETLSRRLNHLFQSTAFDNRFTLHPRRLAELGSEMLHEFESFLVNQDSAAMAQVGGAKAREGLSLRALIGG